MAREGGGEPYFPNLVPQVILPLGRGGADEPEATNAELQTQIIDLERFLTEELDRISIAMIAATVQAAYGALEVDPAAPDQPLVDSLPTIITGFNSFAPAVPNRVTADATGDSLVPEEGGIYQILANLTVNISSGTAYSMTAFVNAQASGVFTTVDASNQTASIQLTLYGMIALNPGDVITLVVIAVGPGGPHTWQIDSAVFGLTRISERNDEPGLF